MVGSTGHSPRAVSVPHAGESPRRRAFVRTLDAGLPLAWLGAVAWLLSRSSYAPNSDAYYHVGCAVQLLERGFLWRFPWLPYTALGPAFPDVHLLQHLLLAPLVALTGPAAALRVAPLLLSAGLGGALYGGLRALRVASPGIWAGLGMLGSTLLLSYATYLKGGSTFHIVLVAYLVGLFRRRAPWTFAMAWLSVYAYVGAPVLLGVALVHAAIVSLVERRVVLRSLWSTMAGLALGLLLNPFFPTHLVHIGHELASVFAGAGDVGAGERGSEWSQVDGAFMLVTSAPFVLGWLWLLTRALSARRRLDATGAAAAGLCTALLLGSLVGGPKIFHLFLLCSVLLLPLVASRLGPFHRVARVGVPLVAACWGGLAVVRLASLFDWHGEPSIGEYEALASAVAEVARPGAVVVAPWDDFPGLFLFNPRNRYVSGMNTQFLRQGDPRRHEAYTQLYRGNVRNPEQLGAMFDGARVVVVKRAPAQARLYRSLRRSPHFTELPQPGPRWHLFQLAPSR